MDGCPLPLPKLGWTKVMSAYHGDLLAVPSLQLWGDMLDQAFLFAIVFKRSTSCHDCCWDIVGGVTLYRNLAARAYLVALLWTMTFKHKQTLIHCLVPTTVVCLLVDQNLPILVDLPITLIIAAIIINVCSC